MKGTLALATFILGLCSSQAAAQTDPITSQATVGAIADRLDQTVRNTMTTLNNSVSSDSFVMRQQLEIIIGQVDAMANGQRDKLFTDLDRSQKAAFQNVSSSIEQLAQTTQITLAQVRATSGVVSVNFSNIPFSKEQPRVSEYYPDYIVSGRYDTGPDQTIDIKGVLLAAGEPTLVMAQTPCRLVTKIDTEAKFVCHASSWATTRGVRAVDGDLTVFKRPGFWSKLIGNKPTPVPYMVSVFVVPASMGTYRVNAVHITTKTLHNSRSQDYDVKNGHCAGAQDVILPFNVTPGWSVDPSSIKPNCSQFNNSSCQGLRNVAATSFGMAAHVENSGTCGVSLFGGHAWSDAQGEVKGTMTWDEVQPKDVPTTDDLGGGPLIWGQSVAIPLQARTQNVQIIIDQMDGQKIIISNSSHSQAWFSTDVDLQAGTVVISPKPVASAL